MHGRNLTGSVANVFDLDVFIRNNRHNYDAFIYGFKVEQSLSAEIAMTVSASIEMKLLFYLRSQDIINSIDADVALKLIKHLRTEIPMTVGAEIEYRVLKYLRKEIINTLESRINVSLKKVTTPNNLPFGFLIGTIDRGRVIAEIEDLYISDIEDLTIYELTAGQTGTRVGLRIGLVRPLRIADIEDFTIAQIQNRTIEDICFVRIH